jgi:hypothetical protein
VLALNEVWNIARCGWRRTRNAFFGMLVFMLPLVALQKGVVNHRLATLALAAYTAWVPRRRRSMELAALAAQPELRPGRNPGVRRTAIASYDAPASVKGSSDALTARFHGGCCVKGGCAPGRV